MSTMRVSWSRWLRLLRSTAEAEARVDAARHEVLRHGL